MHIDLKIFYLISAFIIDRILGDPEFRFHPIRFIGYSAYFFEKFLNKGRLKKLKGFIFAILLITIFWGIFFQIDKLFSKFPLIYGIYHITFLYFGISSYELSKRVLKIEKLLEENIELAKKELSMIVGRDTAPLDKQGIRRAMLETLSENLSDGFVAPLFYYLLGGLPLMYAYKTANTLDSMVGYKNEKFREFGYFSAKIDDLLNYFPARLTAILIFISTIDFEVLKYTIKYGRNHSSPNSGYPEAALAGALKCKFGGPNYYGGILVDKPYIGENDRELTPFDVKKSTKIIRNTSYISLFLAIIYTLILYNTG